MNVLQVLVLLAFGIALVFGMSLLLAIPVMLCWDYALHGLFPNTVPEISFLQAYALTILCRFLFTSTIETKKG